MKKIYFIRHGQTFLNVEHKVCGITESDLTETGIQQAKMAAKKIKAFLDNGTYKIDKILCSPLKRAFDTAKIISDETALPLAVDNRLKEQNFGKYEGTYRTPEFEKLKQSFAYDYEGGESMFSLAQRVYNLLDDLKEKNETYLLVAHGGFSRCLNTYFFNMTNEEYGTFMSENAAVMEYDFN